MNKAWATLDIKAVDRAQRIVEGIASTPTPDRGGDVMDPAGAQFSLPMPFLWKHGDPIGEVFAATVTPQGIHIKAKISTVDPTAPAALQDRIATAWASMTAKPPLVRGLSIGWGPVESEPIKGTRFTRHLKWIWGELSAVVVPMNSEATIVSVKSFDTGRAAPGSTTGSRLPPGATGNVRDGHMTTSEQLTTEKTNLQVKAARLEELLQADETGALDDDGRNERDALMPEIKTLTEKVGRLSTLEAAQAAQASAVVPLAKSTSMYRAPRVEIVKQELPKGTIFTRYAMAVAAGKGSYSDTVAYAKRWDNQTPEVSAYVKSLWNQKAIAGTASSATPGWGSELVNPDTAATEFVELVRAESIIGRVPGFRTVPFNIPIITQTGGSTFGWVGEGGVKPVGELAFTRTTMPYHKVAGIVVLTEELVRLSTPDAEATARRDLVEQCALFLDQQFIRIAVTAGTDNPASITNGVTAPNASGTTLAALMADLNTALGTLTAANVPLTGLVWVTTGEVALRLSLMVTSLGNQPPGINMNPTGGTLLGFPVVVSDSVDADTLVVFKPSEIFLADDGRVSIDASNQATLDMAGSTSAVYHLWQRNCVGLRAERWINWQKRKPTVVAIIDTIAYVPGT